MFLFVYLFVCMGNEVKVKFYILLLGRCFNRDFPFAGMYGGTKCQCTFVIGRNGALGIDNCNQECSGDKSQKCGGRWHEVLVLTTGAGEE